MWLIHSFFCYYFSSVVKIVVWSRYAIPSLLVLVILTYGAAVSVDYFWNAVIKAYSKILEITNFKLGIK